ncbi:MAG TPA: FAD-dependent oxidoreductase [Micromonosporaceae bacterium]|nr:FAD-dependent oxidoreductase [Micromonosporaceae bacterium]
MPDPRTFVIIGASLAGAKAAETLRDEGFDGRIVMIGEESERPYERPPLSKGYLHGKDARDGAYVHNESWYADHDVELRLGVRATGLDPAAHTVTLDGSERLTYDKLLLATGSRPRRLSTEGTDLDGVCYLRTLPDADALLHRLRGGTARRVVVVGAGWIGLETAAAARSFGADVTVVEMDVLPLRRVLGDDVASIFADVHRAHDVTFHFGTGVSGFVGSAGKLEAVVLSNGVQVPADMAIVGVGIEPVTDLAVSAGLTVDNGVVTDASLRTSDPDVYAAGDVASFHSPMLGGRIRVEHWGNALDGGPAAARAMLGSADPYDKVPYFFSDQYEDAPSIGMEYAGWVDRGGYERMVYRGDPTIRADATPEFIAFWVSDGRVLAGMNVNVWDVQDDIQALVRAGHAGKRVDLDRLADESVPLADVVADVSATA